jgi:hypothetical protein
MFSILVFLKIKSATSRHQAKTKAAHSTIKRILLSHVQIVMMSLSLNVPWPPLVEGLMTAVSAVSDVSQHVAKVGCFVDTQDPVLKQARFLYTSSTYIALFPVIFVTIIYVYWLWLVPIPCVGTFLACGRKKAIFLSDPVPNVMRTVCCRGSDCFSGTSGRMQDAAGIAAAAAAAAAAAENHLAYMHNPMAHMHKQKAHRRIASQRRSVMEEVLKDERIKTRDIFSYSTVLFFYMLYPSLCRTSMDILSCQNPHASGQTTSFGMPSGEKGPPEWATELYLRYDVEEPCYVGDHLAYVWLLAVPSLVAYAIGLPLSAFVILWRKRHLHLSKKSIDFLATKKYIFRLGLVYSGYRKERWWWEGVVVSRKLSIIFFSSFMHNDGLQLQFALFTMVANLALHHIFLPFDITDVAPSSGEKDAKYDRRSGQSSGRHLIEDTLRAGRYLGEGRKLHELERNSIIVCTLLLWASSIFVQRLDCGAMVWGFCSFVVLAVFISNIVFFISGVILFVRFFLMRTRLMDHFGAVVSRIREKTRSVSLENRQAPRSAPTSSDKKSGASQPVEVDNPWRASNLALEMGLWREGVNKVDESVSSGGPKRLSSRVAEPVAKKEMPVFTDEASR